jgi:ribose transport system ATP-binding protein
MNPTPFLAVEEVCKSYGGVRALHSVSFACHRYSIHAVIGENGAGKSTLIKIMSGVVKPDSGRIRLDGNEVFFNDPNEAIRRGIVCVFQELSLIPDLSVADNICITNPPRKLGFIDRRAQRRKAEELLARMACEDIDPREHVADLSLSRQQMVEIAKALGRNPNLLILDEATSALTASDVERVFEILKNLRDEGMSIVYITHRLREVEILADRASVFRNGEHMETFRCGERTPDQIVNLMIGRSISKAFPEKATRKDMNRPAVEVIGLRWENRLHDISFEIGQGEIVGLGGLDGQGQGEILLALFGVLRGTHGQIKIDGKITNIRSPASAKHPANGVAMIPEDRKREGLLMRMSVRENISLAALEQMTRVCVLSKREERVSVDEMIHRLNIKLESAENRVASLSGGNQQKVVIAKWLLVGARCLLLMDPTRGIDVGTKQEIYALLRELADQGTAILLYSTDYGELVGMCDRVMILYQGRIVRELEGREITEHNIMASALNLDVSGDMSVTSVRE